MLGHKMNNAVEFILERNQNELFYEAIPTPEQFSVASFEPGHVDDLPRKAPHHHKAEDDDKDLEDFTVHDNEYQQKQKKKNNSKANTTRINISVTSGNSTQ